jgi:hypothetical protein
MLEGVTLIHKQPWITHARLTRVRLPCAGAQPVHMAPRHQYQSYGGRYTNRVAIGPTMEMAEM